MGATRSRSVPDAANIKASQLASKLHRKCRRQRLEEAVMPSNKRTETEFDPMGIAPVMMHYWRVTMFDMPMACALGLNACMTRWIAHQQEFVLSLTGSRDLDDVTTAQKKLVAEAIEDAEAGTAAFQRDLRATLESARLN